MHSIVQTNNCISNSSSSCQVSVPHSPSSPQHHWTDDEQVSKSQGTCTDSKSDLFVAISDISGILRVRLIKLPQSMKNEIYPDILVSMFCLFKCSFCQINMKPPEIRPIAIKFVASY